MAKNVVELNGKRYDAVSGALLSASEQTSKTAAVTPSKSKGKGRHIDGFIRSTASSASGATAPAKHTLQAAHARAARQSKQAAAHQPKRSETLMRQTVHKPEVTIKPAIKSQAPAEIAAKPVSAITHKRSALQVDPERLERAKNVGRHAGIRRFLPAQPNYSPAAVSAVSSHTTKEVPIIAVKEPPTEQPHHIRSHSDIFEAAITRADSHKQPARPLRRSRSRQLVNALAIAGTLGVIGGFIAYLNLPNIQLHVANIQAGFKADLPNYKPTGYALQGGVKRTGNTITMRFQSGENSYIVTQQPSDWNSQTLAENTLALSGDNHKTIEAAGRTIFVYNGSNAVWVNGGVRYDINTKAELTTDDISKLAASM